MAKTKVVKEAEAAKSPKEQKIKTKIDKKVKKALRLGDEIQNKLIKVVADPKTSTGDATNKKKKKPRLSNEIQNKLVKVVAAPKTTNGDKKKKKNHKGKKDNVQSIPEKTDEEMLPAPEASTTLKKNKKEMKLTKKLGKLPASKSGTKGKNEKTEREYDPVEENATVFVGNLPVNTKRNQLTKLFAKCGTVKYIRLRTANGKVLFKHSIRKKSGSINAYVVFIDEEFANKALELNGTVFKTNHLRITKSSRNGHKVDSFNNNESQKRTIFVGNLKLSVDDDKLHEVFSSCGEIEYVRTFPNKGMCCGFVCFKKPESVGLALELNDTMIEDRAVRVNRYKKDQDGEKQAACTVILNNLDDSTTKEDIREHFASCGEIDYVHVHSSEKLKKNMGFLCFKDPNSALEAAKLNNTKLNDKALKIQKFLTNIKSNKSKVEKKNPHRGTMVKGVTKNKKKVKKPNSQMLSLAKKIAPK